MSANVYEERLPLSEQLDKLPESELVRKVRQDFYRTGTCRLEDLYRVLGDPSRPIRIVVQEESAPAVMSAHVKTCLDCWDYLQRKN